MFGFLRRRRARRAGARGTIYEGGYESPRLRYLPGGGVVAAPAAGENSAPESAAARGKANDPGSVDALLERRFRRGARGF
jgi:hypothetical protein